MPLVVAKSKKSFVLIAQLISAQPDTYPYPYPTPRFLHWFYPAVLAQRLVELTHAVPDKFDAAVMARQGAKNLAAKHKDATDTMGGSQRDLIMRTQVATEPDKCGLVIHGGRREIRGVGYGIRLRYISTDCCRRGSRQL